MRVLVTRPETDAARTAAALMERGHEAILSPVMTIRMVDDAKIDPSTYRSIVVTSRHAVVALAQQPAAERLMALPILCVGAATADAARSAGFRSIEAAGGDVEGLLTEVETRDWPAPVLYASGAVVTCDLVAALMKHGMAAERVIVYATDPILDLSDAALQALNEDTLDGVLLFSARTVALFADQVKRAGKHAALSGLTAWCLSKAVGNAAKSAGFGCVVVSKEKTEQSLIAAIHAPQ